MEHLTGKQKKGIEAILQSNSLVEASSRAGVTYKTIQRWSRQEGFKAELRKRQSSIIENVSGRLISGLHQSLDVLEYLMTSGRKESIRLQAVKTWMDITLKFREAFELEERISRLERKIGS